MKKLFTILAVAFCMNASAQKQDSLVLQITMDTTTFKTVVQLIQESINVQTATGKVLLQNILSPLYNFKLVPRELPKAPPADKPKKQ